MDHIALPTVASHPSSGLKHILCAVRQIIAGGQWNNTILQEGDSSRLLVQSGILLHTLSIGIR